MIRCALLVGPLPARDRNGREQELLLSPHESALLGPRAVAKRRDDFLRGRWIAKQLLSMTLPERAPEAFVVLPDALGAPVAHDAALTPIPWSVSLSHTDGFAMAAVCEAPVRIGIDIERPVENPGSLMGEYFTAGELRLCAGLAGPALQRRAALIWSVKETLMKALGHGLRIPATSVGLVSMTTVGASWTPVTVFASEPWLTPSQGIRAWVMDREEWVASLAVVGPGDSLVELGEPGLERVEMGG